MNNFAVTPGQTFIIAVGVGGNGAASAPNYAGGGGSGVVRIVYPGQTRQFPSTNVSSNANELVN